MHMLVIYYPQAHNDVCHREVDYVHFGDLLTTAHEDVSHQEVDIAYMLVIYSPQRMGMSATDSPQNIRMLATDRLTMYMLVIY